MSGAILFWDAVGAPFDGNTPSQKGLGGSELAQIQLAEALAADGYRVKVLVARDENPEPRTINRVTYGHSDLSDVSTVIASRMSPVPPPLAQGHRVIVSLTDMGPHPIAKCDVLVGVSRWQLERFPERRQHAKAIRCIPPIVEHEEVLDTSEKVRGRFVYCSARAKGLDLTLAMWARVRPMLPPEARLQVTTAGWDVPAEGSVEAAGAEWLGVLTPLQIRQVIASAVGLFYVNVYPETFCAVAAIAEASKTRPVISCVNDRGALPEVLNTPLCADPAEFAFMAQEVANNRANIYSPKNFSKNKVVQSWENIL